MKHVKNYLIIPVLLSVVVLFSACDDNENKSRLPGDITESSILVNVDLDAQALYPMHFIQDAAAGGEASIVNAQELLNIGVIMVAIKDKFVYVNEPANFVKLQLNQEGVLQEVGKLPHLGMNGAPSFAFLDNNSLLLSSASTWPANGVIAYQVVNTTTMTEERNAAFQLPIKGIAGNAAYAYSWATTYIVFEGNIYIPFVESDNKDNILYENASVAVYDATTFAYKKTISTSETSVLGNGFNPCAAVSEAGDLYIASDAAGSGIVRIKKGATEFDDDYFFDVTAKTDGLQSLGFVYAGNNKAVIQVYADVDSDYYVTYYVADLAGGSMTKLDIPASLGGYYGVRRSMDRLADGRVAVMTNNAGGNHVYVFDPADNSVTKGLTYVGADALTGLRAFN